MRPSRTSSSGAALFSGSSLGRVASTRMVTTLSRLKAGIQMGRLCKLRRNSAAVDSSTTESMICTTTRALPAANGNAPAAPRSALPGFAAPVRTA